MSPDARGTEMNKTQVLIFRFPKSGTRVAGGVGMAVDGTGHRSLSPAHQARSFMGVLLRKR